MAISNDNRRYQQFAMLLNETIPGLESVIITTLDPKGNLWKNDSEFIDGRNEMLERESAEYNKFANLLIEKAPWEWLFYRELFTTTIPSISAQLSIDDEIHRRVLAIRLRPEKSKLNMMVFLTYPELYSFSLKGTKPGPLSNDQKSLVGFNLYHFINSLIHNSWTTIYEGYDQSAYITGMGLTIEKLHNQLKVKEEDQNNRDIEWLKVFINELSVQDGIDYYVEESVWKYLLDLKKDPGYLLKLLRLAIANAKQMFISKAFYPTPFIISNWHLLNIQLADEQEESISTPAPAFIVSRKERVIAYLEKYEMAAVKLVRLLRPVTGANLGDFLEPAISASAISEFLKKYADILYTLFNESPEKWPTLRNHFKPLQQIIAGTSTYLDQSRLNNVKSN
ncbi:MAG: hypothetical protein LWX70_03925 [Sphingobacteriia bacterium]|nr:hypothetical protein [Sphingobacteriia bacterium]